MPFFAFLRNVLARIEIFKMFIFEHFEPPFITSPVLTPLLFFLRASAGSAVPIRDPGEGIRNQIERHAKYRGSYRAFPLVRDTS